ncbi:hypothetical protein N7448_002560 [Penicillium atrosanguineum]|uniref:uncharacterized protein n=1 Tax=Penicillium atrosanguineum TaxID=1132637 RepID=UPI002388AC39|nr:uncharacterized protein N7443_005961 [Penicillium atrosanguineum]KAJ5145168.1 hypothetical protein N7448_002560 [Penicillium atrosanguineum]KAJ5300959.1 hypothetical protein N7443_005961 [Penicillium atrosanguineum]
MGNVSPTPHQLLVEAIIFWSIGVVIFFGRIISRIIANGSIKRLFWDDYVMTGTFMIYTTLLVLIQISSRYATNLMDPKDYDEVLADPKQVHDRIFGSKIVIGLEQCMLFSTWGVKTCMLILYWRITQNLRSNLYIKILTVYVALGFVVIMVCYYTVYCRPFSQYWAMPVENMQCATYQRYSITQAVFNISSDAVMFAIPIPLLIKAQLKKARKVVLIGVMSLGLFTIIAAILNKYFNFASPLTTIYQIWYIREASTAIYVANLMCWWPLLRKLFGLTAFSYNSNRGRRANDQNKDSGYSGSESQSRPSISRTLERLKPPCRKNANNVPTARHSRHGNTHRSSQEAITQVSGEHDYATETEEYNMDDWNKKKGQGNDIEDSRLATPQLIAPFQQSPLKESQDHINRTV